jgi:hypothetical protein
MTSPWRAGCATAALAVLASLTAACPAGAHALGADCTLVGQKVQVEAFYEDNTPARKARVTVLDEGKAVVAEGRTDAKGCWTFPTPRPGRYRVVVEAGEGHRATVTLTVPEGKRAPPEPGPLIEQLRAVGAEGAGDAEAVSKRLDRPPRR